MFIAISDDKTLRPVNIKIKKKMVGNNKFKILLNVIAANLMVSKFLIIYLRSNRSIKILNFFILMIVLTNQSIT